MHEEHGPAPTLWPLGFAVGIAVGLVGLIVDPEVVGGIGAFIAIVFGFLWARDATSEMRRHVPMVQAEVRPMTPAEAAAVPAAAEGEAAMAPPAPGERFPRSRFLEAATLGLGGVIGGIVTVPVAGFALLPSFLDQKGHKVDMGPVSAYPIGKWFIATFMVDPKEGDVSRRTAFVRNNGTVAQGSTQVPSFTIISNRCAHLGCPVQANGPTGAILGEKNVTEHTKNGAILLRPVVPAGFGCPCHGGQYDTEGNRTAGPPVRALDRYGFEIDNGHLVLLSTFSVAKVVGTGAQAKIYKYKQAGPGQHVDGPEQWFYPLQPPHH
ncbi:MAG TPA: Rieske 2Fe-2S domain-containing protein [Gaiellaceae bacterium]|nr:Rieske 2Fe-2S domain-containing protein [Gaiellaceae bacterium]